MNKTRILVVEDSITQAMQLQHICEVNGYDAAVAANGREALDSVRLSKPSIIISDIVMPEMDGYELCRQIKRDEDLRDIGVILLTSLSQPQAVIWALQCGADKFITKPYEEQSLLAALEHLQLNEPLKGRDETHNALPVSYRGETYHIASNRWQILNLLLSTYETAIAKNLELLEAREELRNLNKDLEERIKARTEALRIEVGERKMVEASLQAKNEELNMVTQQLWQTAKLATMGELASSIAHELNNPLAIVSLRIESLMAQTGEADPHRRELEIIGHEVERMGNLVANLLQFSRRSSPQISTLDVCEEIEKTFELIYYHFRKYNIQLVREFAPDVPKIIADRQQLRQLFLNLFTNAGAAMPGGGTLTIRVTALDEKKRVCIEIADTGTGIPADVLPHVMEPFYTTKPEGKGTGLGLAICRRITQEHRGTLTITSKGVPGDGTTVRIELSSIERGNELVP
jgi:signal transduction histidine kinase